jgi:hypothetical protein
MASTAQRAVVTATVPTLLALAVVAFAVLEQTAVDPTVSAGRVGSSFIPVWYVPLAVFAVAHTLCLLVTMRGRAASGLIAGGMTVALAIAFHILGGPFLVGEAIYGAWVVFAQLLPPLFLLLPIVVVLAIAVPGALYGLSIHAPLAVARRFLIGDGSKDTLGPTRGGLILSGVIVAVVCVIAFGVPSDATRGARGGYSFAPTTVQSAWFIMATVIALCCAVVAIVGALSFTTASAAPSFSWLKGFVVPVAVIVAVGGPAISAIETSAALRVIRNAPGLAAASRYFRDGRPLANEPIRFANGELHVDRSLVRYQQADNPQRLVQTVALRPPPELQALGVKDRIILNGWRAEPHRKEAEYRRAVCTESASRPVVECRLPATGAVVIEIDKDRPERGLYRAATLASDTGCMIIVTGVAERSFGIRADFDCAHADDWSRRAAEIERYITAHHVMP